MFPVYFSAAVTSSKKRNLQLSCGKADESGITPTEWFRSNTALPAPAARPARAELREEAARRQTS